MRPEKKKGLKALALFWLIVVSFHSIARTEDPLLINIKDIAPRIVTDMRYAGPNNFTGRQLYPVAECLLCEPAANRLARVQKSLEQIGLGLKVWDCYRPLSVQKKLWEIFPDPRYVADPKTGSRHNRGSAVDLTLVDEKGREFTMPTRFDEFSVKAHRNFDALPAEVKRNRNLLQREMEKEGFIGLPTEWWHFDDPEWGRYALRDEPLGSSSLQKDISEEAGLLLSGKAQQLILVTSIEWASATGRLQRYERSHRDWKIVGEPWDVSLGAGGLAWGRGVEFPYREGPEKIEGDNTTPAGLFRVGTAYGYDPSPPSGTKWEYKSVDETWICIDDPVSDNYNRIFQYKKDMEKDWSSSEIMRRKDHLYKWVINIEQNPRAVKKCGSCIFFHVWRKPGSPTEGCTAMAEEPMVTLLGWLDPAKFPTVAQFPREIYEKAKRELGLP